ncbi:MAG TPA: enolase C-terminal domain-like protein, partial [Chloroflexota bacterium]|nr:enolase C-terminal domain-like protein [Chloroflexota bacterium]
MDVASLDRINISEASLPDPLASFEIERVKAHVVIHAGRYFRVARDPSRIEDIWQELYRKTFWRGGPILLSAISGIDIALWDLKGKRLNAPVYDLLGGKTRDRVRVYTHIDASDDDALCDLALATIEKGYSALRIVPTLFNANPWDSRRSVRASVRTVERLRSAVGDDVDLLVDVHHRFSPMENVHFGRAIEPYDVFFI